MEFYWTLMCMKCGENRNGSMLSSFDPLICKLCGSKVESVKIYFDLLEDYQKSKSKLKEVLEQIKDLPMDKIQAITTELVCECLKEPSYKNIAEKCLLANDKIYLWRDEVNRKDGLTSEAKK